MDFSESSRDFSPIEQESDQETEKNAELPEIALEKAEPLPEAPPRKNIELDLGQLETGSTFDGTGHTYEFSSLGDLLAEDNSLLESRVRDENGQEFFCHPKNPEQQVAAVEIMRYLKDKLDPLAENLKLPEMRLETINDQPMALMEFFADHAEIEPGENTLSDEEKALLNTLNLLVGNSDFKEDHILADQDEPQALGLIDFDRAFDFSNTDRMSDTAFRFPFLTDGIDPNIYRSQFDSLNEIDELDRQNLIEIVIAKGVEPETAQKLVDATLDRRGVLADEMQTVHELNEAQRKIDEEMFG